MNQTSRNILLRVSPPSYEKDSGFTLLELIVVFLVLGILATVSLPITIAQVGRARESSAKGNLSAISKAQQAYFFENRTFANQLSQLSTSLPTDPYYLYPNPTLLPSGTVVKHEAVPQNAAAANIRHYSLGIYFNADQSYGVSLCQSLTPDTLAEAGDTSTSGCITGILLD